MPYSKKPFERIELIEPLKHGSSFGVWSLRLFVVFGLVFIVCCLLQGVILIEFVEFLFAEFVP